MMSENKQPFGLDEQDVVSVNDSTHYFGSKTFTVQDFMDDLADILQKTEGFKRGRDFDALRAWTKGVECRILQKDQCGWQKGKIKLSMKFIPDVSEPPNSNSREQVNEIEDEIKDVST